ncbi:FHA domain-containing protein [Isoptericola variabilis]|uniref:Forkhead-associated protein n=1 Tax=Isoptericola variabilis (strain 225) TaxID=743718 RepID=F6FVB8_ISOV2|nr:FHA domain-containing protein [Isoptericola variabilis]AEG43391.1 Forkhead-associated protein [Isoptericola variabilis 225]
MTLRYVTGPSYAVVRGGAVVMLPEKVSPELVDELWRVLGRGAGVVPLLEVLTGSFGASLASLPPFAVVVTGGGGAGDDGAGGTRVQVAVRGATTVHVGTADGERVTVTGEAVTTWAERTFDDVAELAVHGALAGAGDTLVDDRGLPLDAGVVLAASVGAVLAERRAGSPSDVARPVADERPAVDLPAAVVDEVPLADAPAAPAAAVPLTSVVPPAAEHDPAPEPEHDRAPEPVHEPEHAPEPAPVEETSGYGHLWGSTVHRGVEAAAVRPEEDEEEADEQHGPQVDGQAGAQVDERDRGDAAGAPSSETAVAAETIAPVMTIAPSTVAPETVAPETIAPETIAPDTVAPASAASPADDDVDASTVLSSAIADLRAAATPSGEAPAVPPGPVFAPAAVPGRPSILARTCPGGHPNPPQRDDCAHCGQPLSGEARQVPRPPLGVMAVSSGPRITLDRPVIVGRRPRSPRSTGDDLPRLVTVPSPEQDISRSHVEVRLEGWHVLVSDMSTTNGTTLLRAGQPPMRLHPGEPVLVVSSDVVDLGDGVTLTFEGIV